MRKLPKDEELDTLMEEMGVPVVQGENVADKQPRYIDASRHLRESRTWVLAALSALASVVSAFAAWWAVLRN
jgi:hypothetical protein